MGYTSIRDKSACSKSLKISITPENSHHIEAMISKKGRLYFLYSRIRLGHRLWGLSELLICTDRIADINATNSCSEKSRGYLSWSITLIWRTYKRTLVLLREPPYAHRMLRMHAPNCMRWLMKPRKPIALLSLQASEAMLFSYLKRTGMPSTKLFTWLRFLKWGSPSARV